MKRLLPALCLALWPLCSNCAPLTINSQDYFDIPGLSVMVFHDYYPDGHQTGVTIVKYGDRIAANGDLRLEPTPGQWSPMPVVGKRVVNREQNEISTPLSYPDPSKDRKGFNPIVYPDLKFKYSVRVKGEENGVRVFVDLNEPLPQEWIGKVGFNLELFPGTYFGKSFVMDECAGVFARQANGPMFKDGDGDFQITPLAEGKRLVVAPESDAQQLAIESVHGKLALLDGRGKFDNGWFVVRSLIPAGATTNAIEWNIRANVSPQWMYPPVVQVSQIGYHPAQSKIAVIEVDKRATDFSEVSVVHYDKEGKKVTVASGKPERWGEFLRYQYMRYDFSKVTEPGVYQLQYGAFTTAPFLISKDVFKRHVWQPTLESFLPVQMCHMRINDRYRVWHGLCHMDDALMAPTNFNHFDGYVQGPSTLTKYASGEHVPNLNSGGWHDAGDYDLRVESQSDTVRVLALAYEEFHVDYDETTIDQSAKVVELHRPDGKPDMLQQVEHGCLTIVNGYRSLGRLYRGIICPTLDQYTLLGDAVNNTDGRVYDPSVKSPETKGIRVGAKDDDWVFTENNPGRELHVAASLALASRVMKDYNPALSKECLAVAQEIWQSDAKARSGEKIEPAIELFLTTGADEYKSFILTNADAIASSMDRFGWLAGRAIPKLANAEFESKLAAGAAKYKSRVDELRKESPYGVPYHPDIWGAGWNIQNFGVKQYFLHKAFPAVFSNEYMLNAMNFVLGCHPGANTASFASGVGANSLTTAYGNNRADWSYIPGGVGSGTALIRPDVPELKVWPYFWQQAEYVMGGGATDFMFLVLAADHSF